MGNLFPKLFSLCMLDSFSVSNGQNLPRYIHRYVRTLKTFQISWNCEAPPSVGGKKNCVCVCVCVCVCEKKLFSQYVRYLAHIFHFVQCAICAHRNMCVSHSFLTICAILHSFLPEFNLLDTPSRQVRLNRMKGTSPRSGHELMKYEDGMRPYPTYALHREVRREVRLPTCAIWRKGASSN